MKSFQSRREEYLSVYNKFKENGHAVQSQYKKTDEGYSVWVPGLPGCWSQGQTEKEALENIKDAIEAWINVKNSDGFVKIEGDKILEYVRNHIKSRTSDEDKRFLLNRWIYARLQNDERRTKDGLRKELMRSQKSLCNHCKKPLKQGERIHLHRRDENRRYLIENCVLVHENCHQEMSKNKKPFS
jgi:predicted RNase H-like HicB family nuclease